MTLGVRILVVDDHIATCEVLADALEVQGYEVQTAADGRQAWDLVQQSPTAYDLVLSDVTMPGMDGLELLTRIRADAPEIQVILMTGHPDPTIPVQAERLGASAVLLKPWGLEQLYRALQRAISERARPADSLCGDDHQMRGQMRGHCAAVYGLVHMHRFRLDPFEEYLKETLAHLIEPIEGP